MNHKIIKNTANAALPILLGGGILYWMYKDFDFSVLESTVQHGMNWWWMSFSLVFGVTAQLFRGLRWRQTLEPLGERPRTADCVHAVFLSYAASIVIPRIGEVARCGVLKRYDGTSFAKALGTVVTERVIDSLLVLAVTAAVILSQIKVFATFFEQTGTTVGDFFHGFSATGYAVTAVCLIATIALGCLLARKLKRADSTAQAIANIKSGITSLKAVRNKWKFTLYTLLIWVSYFLHYYITFMCFDFTRGLSLTAAMVSFVIGSLSVIVPTPNGAGPWHFSVKTILVLYGLSAVEGEAFVLIVHTIQTALIPLLGLYSLAALQLRRPSPGETATPDGAARETGADTQTN